MYYSIKISRHILVTGVFLLLLLSVFATNSIFAQDHIEANSLWKNKAVVSASIQYQNLPDNWNITYYGGSAEFFIDRRLGLSGSLYYGKGSNNKDYIHFPLGGFIAFFIGFFLDQLLDIIEKDTDDYLQEYGVLLITENIHYNIPVSKKILISPYISLFGADGNIVKSGQEGEGGLLSYGVGINVKALLFKRMMVSSFFSVKYFNVSDSEAFGSGSQFGYTANINIGYIFD